MQNYRLGLPAWAFPGWAGKYFDARPSALASYASVFNTVEGNTTFYSTPDKNTVAAWHDAVTGRNFHFCFKLPGEATHQKQIDRKCIANFCHRIEPLRGKLGPLLVQFPATIGPDQLPVIETIFKLVPDEFRTVLEVRHPGFFRQPEVLAPVLQKYRSGLAVMDSRAIFQGNRKHPEVLAALHDKPDVPVWNQVFNNIMFVRLLLHPDKISNQLYVDQWIKRTVKALTSQCEVYMMIHCPNNQHCPEMGLQFHNRLREKVNGLPPLNAWPAPQQTQLL